MKELLFICDWNKNREISWSGTHLQIFNQLKKKYDIIDFDISMNNHSMYSYYENLKKLIKKFFKIKDDLSYAKFLHYEKKINKEYSNIISFSFGYIPISKNIKSFTYIDLSVSCILDFDTSALINSGFSSISNKYLLKFQNRELNHLKNGNYIFTMGNWVANILKEKYPEFKDKIISVGGGINLDHKLINPNKSRNKFLFVGRDFKRKNGYLVIEAFKKLYKKNNTYELYIIGSDINMNIPGIHFIGNTNYKELSHYFNICDVFVMPSLFEAYGLVFPEALCYGLPCIGFNKYEMPYFIKNDENGYLLEENDSKKLSELMEKCILNDKIFSNVFNKRKYYLDLYSWKNVFSKMEIEMEK